MNESRLGLAQGATQVAGHLLGFALRGGAKHGLAVNLDLVAEKGESHPNPAAMASIGLQCRHVPLSIAYPMLDCLRRLLFG